MLLSGHKIAILMESDYFEPEIFYYRQRFPEEGAEVHFLSRLWGQERLTFKGHEYGLPFEVDASFEHIDDATLRGYSAVIVPSGIVADRLRYTENPKAIPPASAFLRRAFAHRNIVKGIICHGMWLAAPIPESVRGRRAVVHNNLLGDFANMGGVYVDQDVVVDGDLITARTAEEANRFARTVIDQIVARHPAGARS
jgi:protease I